MEVLEIRENLQDIGVITRLVEQIAQDGHDWRRLIGEVKDPRGL